MADDLIYCPACNSKLQLPAELYGQTVECPQCRNRFVTPVPRAPAPPVLRSVPLDPQALAYGPEATYAALDWPLVVERARSALRAPAGVLILLSGIAILFAAYGALSTDQTVRAMREMARDPKLSPEMRDFLNKTVAADPVVLRTTNLVFLGLNLVTLIGAVQMLRLQLYWLAVTGSILALNPLNCPCCFLMAPFGLWALIVLLNNDVRRAFQ
jgi:hypothetical protein